MAGQESNGSRDRDRMSAFKVEHKRQSAAVKNQSTWFEGSALPAKATQRPKFICQELCCQLPKHITKLQSTGQNNLSRYKPSLGRLEESH